MPPAKMPSITLSQLRNTRQLLAWLRAGLTVELRERNRVIAHIIPDKAFVNSQVESSQKRGPKKGRQAGW